MPIIAVRMGSVSRSIGTTSGQLEATLITVLSIYNFEEARSYVRRIPEDQRLVPLVRIV